MPTTDAELDDFYAVPNDSEDTTDLWVAAIDGVMAVEPGDTQKELQYIIAGHKPVLPGEQWEELSDCQMLLCECNLALKAVRNAAAAGGVARFPATFKAGFNSTLPYRDNAHTVSRLLVLSAYVNARDGASDLAFEDVRALFALAYAFRAEPTMISQLVRIAVHHSGSQAAVELMSSCNWDDQQLAELQVAVLDFDLKQSLTTVLVGERALGLSTIRTAPMGPLALFRQAASRDFLLRSDHFLNATHLPWSNAIKEMELLESEWSKQTDSTFGKLRTYPLWLIWNPMPYLFTSGARADSRKNLTVVALAAQRYRLKHGILPAAMEELTSEFLPSVDTDLKIDHFDNKPLRFVVEESGITIYSIGDDRVDNGGEIERTDEIPRPRDIGVSLIR